MSKHHPSVISGPCYSALIKVCQVKGRVDKAKQFLEKAVTWDETNNAALLSSFLRVCAIDNDLKTALDTFLYFKDNIEGSINIASLNSMLSVCAECNDIYTALCIESLRKEWRISGSKPYFVTMAMVYLKDKQFDEALAYLAQAENAVDANESAVDQVVLTSKIAIMNEKLAHCAIDESVKKKAIFDEIQKLFHIFENENLEITFHIRKMMLASHIYLNSEEWWNVVNYFDSLLKDKDSKFNLWSMDQKVNVHHYSHEECRFVLRYFFAFYSRNQIERQFPKFNIAIVSGKATHSGQIAKRAGETLQNTVIDELKSWNPPIYTEIDSSNKGVLICNANQVKSFFKANPIGSYNFASKSLNRLKSDDSHNNIDEEEEKWKRL